MLSYLQTIHLYFPLFMTARLSADVLNKDLEMIHDWAFQWKMNFNPNPTKQAQEVTKRKKQKNTSSSFSV